MACRRPFLTIGFCFLWTHLVAIPADAGVPKDNPVPDVRMDDTRDPHGSTAVFWVGNRRESLVDVRLDGVKLVVRSIGGDAPIRIVIDHLPPGRHRQDTLEAAVFSPKKRPSEFRFSTFDRA